MLPCLVDMLVQKLQQVALINQRNFMTLSKTTISFSCASPYVHVSLHDCHHIQPILTLPNLCTLYIAKKKNVIS